MNKMKTLVAFATLMLCGGAWADAGDVISINFYQADTQKVTTDQTTVAGTIPASAWYNVSAARESHTTTDSNLSSYNPTTQASKQTTLSYSQTFTEKNIRQTQNLISDSAYSYLKAALATKAADYTGTAKVDITSIPYDKYDVVMYFFVSAGENTAKDDGQQTAFHVSPAGTDDADYTQYTVNDEGAPVAGSTAWGRGSDRTYVLGQNTVKFTGLTSSEFHFKHTSANSGLCAIQIINRASVNDHVSWDLPLDSSVTAALPFSRDSGLMNLNLAHSEICPEGAKVAVSKIKFVVSSSDSNWPTAITINGKTSSSRTTEDITGFTSKTNYTFNKFVIYNFDELVVNVDQDYPISYSGVFKVGAIVSPDAPVKTTITNGWESYDVYALVSGTIQAFSGSTYTATLNANTTFASIDFDDQDNPPSAQTPVELTINGDVTVTVDADTEIDSLTLKGSGNFKLTGSSMLTLGSIDATRLSGSVTLDAGTAIPTSAPVRAGSTKLVYNYSGNDELNLTHLSFSGDFTKGGSGTASLTKNIASGTTLTVAAGTLKFATVGSYKMEGRLVVLADATLVSTKTDAFGIDTDNARADIYGTLNMNGTRWTLGRNNHPNDIYFYPGSKVVGLGESTNGAFDNGQGDKTNLHFVKNNGVDGEVTFNTEIRFRDANGYNAGLQIEEGMTVNYINTVGFRSNQGKLILSGGGTFAIGADANLTNLSGLNIGEHVTVTVASGKNVGTVNGAGTIVFDGWMPTSSNITIGDEWTGVVYIKNKSGSAIPFTDLGRAGSVIRFTKVAGWANQNTCNAIVDLVDGENGEVAFTHTGANDNAAYKFAGLSGSGTFKMTVNTSDGYTRPCYFAFADVSGFTGSIDAARPVFVGANEGSTDDKAKIVIANAATTLTAKSVSTTPISGVNRKGVKTVDNGDGTKSYSLVDAEASCNGTNYETLSEAITAANAVDAEDNKVTVTLLANSSDAISIDEYVTVDTGAFTVSGKITGSGTIIFTNKWPGTGVPRSGLTNSDEWTGVLWFKNMDWQNFNLAEFGNARSTVRFTGVTGYSPQGNEGTNGFNGTLDLVDDGNTKAFNINNDYSSTYYFARLTGSGTFQTSSGHSAVARFAVKDASDFKGTFMLDGKKGVVVGDVTDGNSYGTQTAKLVINANKTAKIATNKTWTAADGITVNGTIKGPGTLGSATTFGDGATIDLTDGALMMASAKSVTFNGALNLVGASIGSTVLSGVSTVSAYPTTVAIGGSSGYRLVLDGGNLKVADSSVAMIGVRGFGTIAEALEAAAADDIVTLCANVTGGLTIPANKKVDAGAYTIDGAIEIDADSTLTMNFTGERNVYGISGKGTLILNGTGTLNVLNKSGGYAVDGTTIEVNSGTFRLYTGSSGCYTAKPADATTHDVKFVIGKSGSITSHGWVNFVGKMTCSYSGDTEKSIISNTFRGTPNLIKEGTGTLKFDVSPDGNSSYFATVDVKAGVLKVRNDSLTLPSASSINGPGTLDANLTLADGASINLEPGALTLGSSRALTFSGAININGEPGEGVDIFTGLSAEPDALSFVGVTVNNEAVANAHLYYEDGAVKYSVQGGTTWTPNIAALDGNILDWTKPNAWMNGSTPATWPTEQSMAEDLSVEIDATEIKGVKIEGQVYVKSVVVSGTLGDNESFQFHNRLKTVNNEQEVESEGEGRDCLHTSGVNLTDLGGVLGMKVPITGTIALGSGTRLVFATGTGETPSTAYGYEFVNRGGSITVDGSGKFIVPSSMYGLAFSVNATATIVYDGANNVNGSLSGTGTVELKGGTSLTLNPQKGQTLHYVSSGATANTMRWVSDYGNAVSSNDSKEKPFVTIERGSTLNIYGHDYSGWQGAVGNDSWFVNNGILVFQNDDGSRFWRDHLVLGNGSTVKIDTGARHILLYGGVGTAENCQIMLASGTATIAAGVKNQNKDCQSLYFGNDGSGDYGDNTAATHTAGISVGNGAVLTVEVPVAGSDSLTKWGAGKLVLSNVTSYTGTITLADGSLAVPAKLADDRVVPASGFKLKFDEVTKTYSLFTSVAQVGEGETAQYFATIDEAIEAAAAANGAVITLTDPSAAAPAGFTKIAGGVLKACDYVVISPNAYVSDWQTYVTARKAMPAAEGLVLGVKNAAEIYTAYPYAAGKTDGTPRNAAESIHKWIGIMQKLGTKYFVLGGVWKDARSISESDKDIVIPGITAYPIKPSASSIMNDRPSDLYYACHFLANDQKYVWDPSGDGVYVGFHETNPDVMTDPRHFQPTCVVSRMAFWPGFDGSTKTYSDLIAAYKDKLVRGEAYDFAGNGYYLTWVDRAIAYRADGMPDAYDVMADRLHAIVNHRTANELLQIAVTKNLTEEELASKKVPLLTRNWEIAMPFGHGTPEGAAGLYGSDYVRNTGLTKLFMANVPCFTGYLGAGDATLAHCALSNPNGGALVSINNTGYGYTTEIGLTERYIGVSEEMLDYTLDAYVAGATAGEAWRTAISDFAGNILDPETMDAKLEARGYDGTDATYKIDNKCFVYAAIVEEELFGDPLVAINERDVYAKDNTFATFRTSKDSETEVAAANLRPTDRIAFDKAIFTTGANAINLASENLSGHRLYFVPSEVGNKAVWTTASDVVANQQILVGKNTTLQLRENTSLQNGSIISGEGVVTVSGERTVSINGLVQIYTDIGYKSSYIFVLGSKDSVLKVKAKMNDNTIGPGYDWDAKTTISAMCNDFGFAGATYTAAIEGDVPESMKEIVVPEGATALALLPSQTADLSAIKVNQDFIDDVKVQIPNSFDGGMIDLTSYFTKTVKNNILSLQLNDEAKPAATDMTVSMPGNDIKIMVQNPIPGLCYSIVAADSADGFVDEHGVEKMNLDESERMQVIPYYGSTPPAPLTFTYDPAKKVQYFKVRVSPSANYGK